MVPTRSQRMGWGADSSREDRPGVPQELDPPHPLGNAHWQSPEQQSAARPPSAIERHHELTPVYGTVNPPRALSGVIRRMAYRLPDYKRRRWLMLMLADRVDVIEHTLLPSALGVAVLGLLGLGAVMGIRALRSAS